jgi:hypothetical protein
VLGSYKAGKQEGYKAGKLGGRKAIKLAGRKPWKFLNLQASWLSSFQALNSAISYELFQLSSFQASQLSSHRVFGVCPASVANLKVEECLRKSRGYIKIKSDMIDSEVSFIYISGQYILGQEKQLPYKGRKVLYFIGCAVVDTSCCGPGGCSYALVPGFVIHWKYRLTPENLPVTQVDPIWNTDVQKELRRLIKQKEPVQQVDFE